MKAQLYILIITLSSTNLLSQLAIIDFMSEVLGTGDYIDVEVSNELIFCANIYGVVIYSFDVDNPDEPPRELTHFSTGMSLLTVLFKRSLRRKP